MAKEDQDIGSFEEPFVRGDSKTIKVTVTQPDGSVKDITGASVEWAMSPKHSTTSTLSKSTSSGGISITDAGSGKFEVSLDPSDTESLDGGQYEHEAEVTDSSGNVTTVLRGTVYLDEDSA